MRHPLERIVSLPRHDGPVITDFGGDLDAPVLVCGLGGVRCKYLGVHDFHYFYCAAQDAPNKHAKPNEYAYPWHGAGKHLFGNRPDAGCPYGQANEGLVPTFEV